MGGMLVVTDHTDRVDYEDNEGCNTDGWGNDSGDNFSCDNSGKDTENVDNEGNDTDSGDDGGTDDRTGTERLWRWQVQPSPAHLGEHGHYGDGHTDEQVERGEELVQLALAGSRARVVHDNQHIGRDHSSIPLRCLVFSV